MSAAVLELRDVTVRHGDGPPVLTGVSLTLGAGERVALLGLNGSGKTTLLGACVGLTPHGGQIHIGGERLTPSSLAAVRERVGFVFNVPEDQLLFPEVLEDAAFGLKRRGVPVAEAVARTRKVLAGLGIEHLATAPVGHLSHGQKQRVALAGALAPEPVLLLLDEPSAGLDPPAKRKLAALLTQLKVTMLMATHDLDFAASFCTRFVLLGDGKVQSDAPDLDQARRTWELEPAGNRS